MINEKESEQKETSTESIKTADIDAFETVDENARPVDKPAEESQAGNEETSPEIPDTVQMIDYGPNEHTELNLGSPLKEPLKKPFDPATQDYLDLPSMSLEEFAKVTGTYKNYQLAQNEETDRWRQSASRARAMYLTGAVFDHSFKIEDSRWRQSMQVGTEEVRADRPKFMEPTGNRLSGEEARLRIRAVLSSGNRVRVPLWHTGIWITIKAPTEAALLELDQRIANQKVELGRLSSGLVYSSTNVYIAEALIDFIIEHISETSYQGEIAELRTLILQPDYQQMVWGLLCAIYVDGYIYQQPCMVNPFKCLHVETARLNFGKMSFVNDAVFTDFQRQHMRKRKAGSQSKLDVERYISEHKFNKKAVVKLHENLLMELKVPTLDEYIQAGHDWIDDTVRSVEDVFGKEGNEDERNAQIRRHANMTILRQYAHWVRMITIKDQDLHVEDKDTIQDVLSDLTSDDEIFKAFFDGIKDYIDNIVVNIHGIPKYPCPSCGEEPSPEILKHPMIFPIDLPEAFFILVVQRIRRILVRQTA